MIYAFKPGAHIRKGLDAQTLGERLTSLGVSDSQGFSAKRVVDDARPEDSPLHSQFDWDDAVAGECWREQQARGLIRAVVTVPQHEGETSVRAFVVVSEVGKQHYVPTYVAMSNEQLRAQVLTRALNELKQFQAKYRELKEFTELFEAIAKVSSAA